MNPFNIQLNVFRNRTWVQSFTLFDANSNPFDVSLDELALVVFPEPPISGSMPVIANSAPAVDVNVVTFETPDLVMASLTASTVSSYNWQFLRRPYPAGSGADSYVVVGGPLNVSDSPPFPGG